VVVVWKVLFGSDLIFHLWLAEEVASFSWHVFRNTLSAMNYCFSAAAVSFVDFHSIQVNQQYVSVFLTAGNIKFLLLHPGKGEAEIKNFFYEVHELYVKLAMNPFYKYDTPIRSKEFDKRVRATARRNLF